MARQKSLFEPLHVFEMTTQGLKIPGDATPVQAWAALEDTGRRIGCARERSDTILTYIDRLAEALRRIRTPTIDGVAVHVLLHDLVAWLVWYRKAQQRPSCARRARRTLMALFVVFGCASFAPTDASALTCRCECYHTAYGRQCRQICYQPQPSYSPEPSYTYNNAAYGGASPLPPELLGLGLIALAVLSVVALAAVANESATAGFIENTSDLRDQASRFHSATADTRDQIASIEEAIEQETNAAYQRGRDRADAAWHDR